MNVVEKNLLGKVFATDSYTAIKGEIVLGVNQKIKSTLLAGYMLFGILSASTVSYAESHEIRYDDTKRTVSVSGIADINSGEYIHDVTLQIFQPGKTEQDLKQATSDNLKQILEYTAQTTPDASGKYSFSCQLKTGAAQGYRTLRIVYADGTKQEASFLFADGQEQTLEKQINQAASADDFQKILKDYSDIFNTGFEVYDILLKQDEKASFLAEIAAKLAESKSYHDVLSFTEAYREKTVLYAVANAPSADISKILANSQEVGIYSLVTYQKTYSSLSKEQQKAVCDALKAAKPTSISSLRELFCEQTILTAVNDALNWKTIQGVLQDNRDVSVMSGIDYEEYDALIEQNENEAADKIVVDGFYQTLTELTDAVNDAVDEVIHSLKKKPSTGSRGGGSSSGGSWNVSEEKAYTTPTAFGDIESVAWAKNAIAELAKRSIVSGKSANQFCPNDSVTRAEYAKMIALTFGLHREYENAYFTDVSKENWAYSYIASLANAGILNGREDGSFGAGEMITREDMAVIAYRAYCYVGFGEVPAASGSFGDDTQISDYAKASVYAMKKMNIINGVGEDCFAPKQNSTRAQAAKIIYGLLQTMGEV